MTVPKGFIQKDFCFEASHRCLQTGGHEARLHGHTWRLTVVVAAGTTTFEHGRVVQPTHIAECMERLLPLYLDHQHLNETLEIDGDPTAERVAMWVYDYLKGRLPGLVSVRLEEGAVQCVVYMP